METSRQDWQDPGKMSIYIYIYRLYIYIYIYIYLYQKNVFFGKETHWVRWDLLSRSRHKMFLTEPTPGHNDSDLTRTKSRDGWRAMLISKQERSDTQNDERVAWAHRRFSQRLCAARNMNIENPKSNVLPRFQPLFLEVSEVLQVRASATENEPKASEVLRLPLKMITMYQIKKDDNLTKRGWAL